MPTSLPNRGLSKYIHNNNLKNRQDNIYKYKFICLLRKQPFTKLNKFVQLFTPILKEYTQKCLAKCMAGNPAKPVVLKFAYYK